MVGALPVFLATYHSACPSASPGAVLVPAASSSARPRPAGDVDGDDGRSTDTAGHGEDDDACPDYAGVPDHDAGEPAHGADEADHDAHHNDTPRGSPGLSIRWT